MMQLLRHTRFVTLLAVFFVTIVLLGVSAAQDPESTPTFRTSVEVVNILCTVRSGDHYISTLDKDDFEIFEDGERQEIRFFARESGEDARPLNIALLVDTSGSVKEKLFFEQEAANAFLEETLRPKKDMAAVIQFDSEINLVQDFTYDLSLLQNSIGDIRAGGATKLYDAIWVTAEDLIRHEVGRRVLVVLSDGDDTQSIKEDEEAIRKAQEYDIVIFGIGVRGERFRSDFGKLKEFARETGGLFFNSKARLDELREAFAEINAAIKNQYSLGYVPSSPGGSDTFREIEVKVKGGLKVSHRKGYYASKP